MGATNEPLKRGSGLGRGARSVVGNVLRGVDRPRDDGYEEARTTWNDMVDERFALIAHCTSTDDVVAVVNAAGEHAVLLPVRGGAHGIIGKALCTGGITLTPSPE